MNLPIVQGVQDSGMGICPGCGGQDSVAPGAFTVLSAGAMYPVGSDVAVPAFDCLGFFDIASHGDGRTSGGSVRIAQDVQGGQFSIYFCSTKCLRSFLNKCVDQLER